MVGFQAPAGEGLRRGVRADSEAAATVSQDKPYLADLLTSLTLFHFFMLA